MYVIAGSPDAYGRKLASAREEAHGESASAQTAVSTGANISPQTTRLRDARIRASPTLYGVLNLLAAATRIGAALTGRRLALEQDPAQLVFLARLQDREHLVAGAELSRADGDLRVAVAHD